jgi:hypothetical protein
MTAQDRPLQGRRTIGCSNIVRLDRTPSKLTMAREEQQLGFGDKN